MNNRNTTHTSFWSGDYFNSFETANDTRKLYQLAQGKRAIANFVNISTGKRIPVTFNSRGDSYTDSNSVVIGSDIESPKDFDVAVGLALHEASHIVHTDFSILRNLDDKIGYIRLDGAKDKFGWSYMKTKSIVKDLLNVIEDRRLDELNYRTSPGYREYYRKMYDKYFNSRVIDKALKSKEYTTEDLDSYLFRIINLHNPNTRLKALKGLGTHS